MSVAEIAGLNHITLSVSDLNRSLDFYQELLGFRVRAIWSDGAYLEAGSLWLCLSMETLSEKGRSTNYTHIALDVRPEDFETLRHRVENEAEIWKRNTSEGASVYFLDPDGHKLELHVGSLASRLEHYLAAGRTDVDIFS